MVSLARASAGGEIVCGSGRMSAGRGARSASDHSARADGGGPLGTGASTVLPQTGVRGGAAALILAMHVVSQRRAAGGADLPLGRRDADGEGRHSLLVRNLMQSLRPARYMSLPAGRATANGRSPLGWRFRQGAFSAGAFGMAGCTVMLSRRSPTPGP